LSDLLNLFSVDSYMVQDEDLKEGGLRLLEADNQLVLPSLTIIRMLITSEDVIHSFAVPGLGFKSDSVPGRLNQTWLTILKEGLYYGQCSELCGINHSFMPINLEVIDAETWLVYLATERLLQGDLPKWYRVDYEGGVNWLAFFKPYELIKDTYRSTLDHPDSKAYAWEDFERWEREIQAEIDAEKAAEKAKLDLESQNLANKAFIEMMAEQDVEIAIELAKAAAKVELVKGAANDLELQKLTEEELIRMSDQLDIEIDIVTKQLKAAKAAEAGEAVKAAWEAWETTYVGKGDKNIENDKIVTSSKDSSTNFSLENSEKISKCRRR
jgi:hypothetical protein